MESDSDKVENGKLETMVLGKPCKEVIFEEKGKIMGMDVTREQYSEILNYLGLNNFYRC